MSKPQLITRPKEQAGIRIWEVEIGNNICRDHVVASNINEAIEKALYHHLAYKKDIPEEYYVSSVKEEVESDY